MLYVFYGNNSVGVRKRAQECIAKLGGEAEPVWITPETYSEHMFEDAAHATSLFHAKNVYVLDTLLKHDEAAAALEDALALFRDSANTFVLIEDTLPAARKAALKKNAEECVEVSEPASRQFNIFALADALVARDKKQLWLLLQKADRAGVSSEEVIGTLYWQLKMIRLSAHTTSPDEAGIKPFVYSKAKKALSKFTEAEITALSRDLLTIYHESHRGAAQGDQALERWLLTL